MLSFKQFVEKAPSGGEEWIKKNKKRFIARYGEKKGLSILYGKAWNLFGQNEALDNKQQKRPNENPGELHPDNEQDYEQIGPHLKVGNHRLRVLQKSKTTIGPPPPGSPPGTNGEKVHSGQINAVGDDNRIHLTMNFTRVNNDNKPDLQGKNIGRITALARGKRQRKSGDPAGIYSAVLAHIAHHHGPIVTSSSSPGAQRAWVSHAEGNHGTKVIGRDSDGKERQVTTHQDMYATDGPVKDRLLRIEKK